MNSLYLIGNHEVEKVIMAVVGNINTIGILLNYSITSYIFTNQTQLISYEEATNIYVTMNGNNKVFVIDIKSVSFRTRVLKNTQIQSFMFLI